MAVEDNLVSLVERAFTPTRSPYHYVPTESITILFVVLFSISTLAHLGQSIYFRLWWLIPTAGFCGILEIIGWSARLWSSINPLDGQPFEMQLTATIIGPTPLLAANFVILGEIIKRLGPEYSRMTPRLYTIIFCTCDVISLVVQGVGGGLAAMAVNRNEDPTKGGHVMLGGIVFQLVTISVYATCASEFFFRYSRDKPVRQAKKELGQSTKQRGAMGNGLMFMIFALIFMTICLFIRAVYRTIELSDGWSGRIISTQVYFNVLDGAMITLAFYTLNIAHPGFLLKTFPSNRIGEKKGSDKHSTDTIA